LNNKKKNVSFEGKNKNLEAVKRCLVYRIELPFAVAAIAIAVNFSKE
jgi:hypothetical protein